MWVSEKLASVAVKDGYKILGTWMDITEWKVAEAISAEHARQTELLLHLGATVGSTLNLSNIIQSVIDDLCRALTFPAVALFILKPDEESLWLAGQRGFSDELVIRLSTVKVGRGFIGRVALTGKPIMLSPTLDDPRFDPALIQKDGLWSLYSVPIFARGQIKGVICVGNRDQQHSIETDARLIELTSNTIGVAIDNAMLYEKTIEMAYTDSLTRLYNRRYLEEELEREFHRSQRSNRSLAVLSLDVDGLKTINDKYGHEHGDRVLKLVSQAIRNNTRKSDVAARVGGDEFILLAPETDAKQAMEIAQRVRKEINSNFLVMSGKKQHLQILHWSSCLSRAWI